MYTLGSFVIIAEYLTYAGSGRSKIRFLLTLTHEHVRPIQLRKNELIYIYIYNIKRQNNTSQYSLLANLIHFLASLIVLPFLN